MSDMDRDEQIKDTAERFYLNNEQDNYEDERLYQAFIRGAKWADANPQMKLETFSFNGETYKVCDNSNGNECCMLGNMYQCYIACHDGHCPLDCKKQHLEMI